MTAQADLIRDKRRHFAAPGGAHDRLIGFLAKALPAAIGVVAAVMILSPLSQRGEISFILDRNKVAITGDQGADRGKHVARLPPTLDQAVDILLRMDSPDIGEDRRARGPGPGRPSHRAGGPRSSGWLRGLAQEALRLSGQTTSRS